MSGLVEGVIAVLGLMGALWVSLAALMAGDAPSSWRQDGLQHHPHTIRLENERMAA